MTAFGDDNHRAIEIQIEVLQDALSETEIYERYDDEDLNDHEKDNAIEACQWLEGESETPSLAADWEPLAVK